METNLWEPFLERATRELGKTVTVSVTCMDPETMELFKNVIVEGVEEPMRWYVTTGAKLLEQGHTEEQVLDTLLAELKKHAGES